MSLSAKWPEDRMMRRLARMLEEARRLEQRCQKTTDKAARAFARSVEQRERVEDMIAQRDRQLRERERFYAEGAERRAKDPDGPPHPAA